MKGRFASSFALCLLSLTTPQWTSAQTEGPYAHGIYRFVLDDELVKYLEFDASTDARGVTTGSLTFNDPARIPDSDDPENPGDALPDFTIKASLNVLTIEKNRAMMSGMVQDSTHRTYLGKWIQLVVEDNGEGLRVPDQLVWRICQRQPAGWIPSDAEWKDDTGAYLSWWATDAERRDDVGIPSESLLPKEDAGCKVLPLALYSFAEPLQWDGDIVVQP